VTTTEKKKPVRMSDELRLQSKLEATLEKSGLSLPEQYRALSGVMERKSAKLRSDVTVELAQQRQG